MKSLREPFIEPDEETAVRFFWWRAKSDDQWQILLVVEGDHERLVALQFDGTPTLVMENGGQWIECVNPSASNAANALTAKEVVELW